MNWWGLNNIMNNIVFLHSSSELYGSDRSLLNLVKNLDKDKFNITVILPEDGPLVLGLFIQIIYILLII